MTLADDPAPLRIAVVRGNPTDDELAALVAVVTAAYAEEAGDALADDEPTRSAWSLSQRGLRRPLARDRGWGNFPG
ncbi:MAG TPA: acyl-CoA carboxylase epsilon subunit [Microbacterium sp.]|nr:acyl-CoA carboxylase epsilon subunit [Microbacterium sp.]